MSSSHASGVMVTTVLQSEVYEAFRDVGPAEDKALEAAAVLGKRDGDLTAAVASLKLDIAAVKADQVLTKRTIGFLLAFNVAIVFKPFANQGCGMALRRRARRVGDAGTCCGVVGKNGELTPLRRSCSRAPSIRGCQ